MLARVGLLARSPCLSVSLSVTSRSSMETVGLIELFLAREIPSTYSTCHVSTFEYLENKGTSLWNFVLNSGLRKFRHGISIVEAC